MLKPYNHFQANDSASGCSFTDKESASTILKMIAYTSISLLSLAGNTLVLAVFRKNRELRSVVFYFIANMAVSDLVLPLFAFPRAIGEIINGPLTWMLDGSIGSLSCKMATFLQDISTAVSIESLVVIALERFVSVVHSDRKSFLSSQKTRRTVLVCTWVLAILLHLPYLFVFEIVKANGKQFCLPLWSSDRRWRMTIPVIYFVSIFTVLYALPFLLLAILYSAIVHKLRHLDIPGCNCSQRRRRQERNRTITIMAMIFVAAFFLCWTPFFIYAFLLCFKWHLDMPCSQINFRFTVILIAHLNSAINPFIYFLCSKSFRKGVRNVIPLCLEI
ncbi:galanin receptor type 2-like isoform X1 [Exaiptasia diaphana]|uniref:G-protein coupled receptors family 1 profile domain-containing protein n=1 Tax=Exaiptasia diaphana TaxID=2652724 RepID=A0A913YU99_EXADI|nr:galanin receptor type 2-like isoform X1 [Exaiptasia diaphana]